ncbi:MAG: response regulator [Magnetococcales bacterium]|nr:response regulator [Magnetococcales bacterium]
MLTIRKKIGLALVGLVALVSAAMAVVGYVTLSNTISQVQQKEMSLLAMTQARTIHDRLNSLRRQFVEMATAREIDVYISEFKEDILRFHFQRFQPTFPFLLYANQNGEVEFQSDSGSLVDGNPLASLTDLPQFPKAKDNPNQVLFFPVLEGKEGFPILRMLYVVRTYFDDFGGAILGEMPLLELFSGFVSANPGESGFSMLVDDKGRILYHQDRSRLFQPYQTTWKRSEPIFQKILNREEGFGSAEITGLSALVAVAPVADNPWSVVVVLPHQESLLPARQIGQLYFLFFLGISLVGTFISWWLAHTITTPLTQLEEAAKALSAGKMSTRVAIHSNDEVGGVINSFNKMAHDLEEGNRELQREVEERTRLEQAHRMAKKEAEQANQSKSNFLASMSHEIRTPMNAILGMTELLGNSDTSPEQRQAYIRVLKRNGEGLLVLINDILDVSRVESGQIQLESVAFNLSELTDEVLSTFQVMVNEKEITLSRTIEEGMVLWRMGDPTRLRQILVNLLSNAVKFTFDGEIEVALSASPDEKDDQSVRIMVSDSGIGVPLEKVESIFEKFIQADSTLTRKFGGSGLGLSLCREFVELMQGKIWLESREGEGSRFIFDIRLPQATAEAVPKKPPALNPTQEDNSALFANKHLLVVEDSEDNLFLIQAFLKGYNLRYTVAENGQEAIECFKSGSFDLVLMDIHMPVMDGYSATRAIRAWERSQQRPKTRILALTANALPGDVEQTYGVGCDGHLSKPINKKSFLEVLSRFLSPAPLSHERCSPTSSEKDQDNTNIFPMRESDPEH